MKNLSSQTHVVIPISSGRIPHPNLVPDCHFSQDIHFAVAVVDKKERFEFVSPSFQETFATETGGPGSLKEWLDRFFPEPSNRDLIMSLMDGEWHDETMRGPQDFRIIHEDGRSHTVRFRGFSIGRDRSVLIVTRLPEPTYSCGNDGPWSTTYCSLVENLSDFVFALDPDGRVLNLNRTAARTFGYEPEELIGRSIEKIIPGPVRKYVAKSLERLGREDFAQGISQYVAKDGAIHYLEYRTNLVGEPGKPDYIVGVARDVTERVLTKKALKESEEKFKILVESAHDGIAQFDTEGVILFANPRMKEILKDPDPVGKHINEFYDEENRRILEENLSIRREGRSTTYFSTITDAQGNRRKMVVSGTPHFDDKKNVKGAIGVYTDISELKKLEAQLQQSLKMEAIGTLAGGIAHDFNNILSSVMGYASLIRRHAGDDSRLNQYAEVIEKSAERGAALAAQLLAFARKEKRVHKKLDVHDIVRDVVEILRHTVDRKISVVTKPEAELSVVEGDPGQIQQALMNLCVNARDAMPNGGTLFITTDTVNLDESFCRTQEGLTPGPHLQITVEDNGEGIPNEVKDRIFEPFFTTKSDGKGTGLGLAMVYSSIKGHRGHVRVYSEEGVGTTFIILLPVTDQELDADVEAGTQSPTLGSGTILVVDDEEMIRDLLCEMLREIGFDVITAQDGQEGVDIYRKRGTEIDLVILDMVMPKLSGPEVFQKLKKINPDIKVILSTGFSRDTAVQETLDQGILEFVQKPYRMDQLSAALSKVLAGE